MDYEKKYKEALEKLQEALTPTEDGCKTSGLTRGCIENIFPELKENKKEWIEKIRQELKSYLEHREIKQISESDAILQWIAWIEKQGKQKSADKVEPKFKVGDIIINIHYKWDGKDRIREITDGKYIFDSGSYINIEEQNSWELANKVGPKFHEGDWIVSNDKKSTYQVIEVKRGIYVIRNNADNNEYHIGIEEYEKSGRLWSIQDAKPGDVLTSKDELSILIFRNLDTSTSFSSYYNIRRKGELGWSNECFIPSTKEQRDLLFLKMKEAGYIFDFDKKELKKIENKTTKCRK